LSGCKWKPHNEVIPACRFEYDKKTKTFIGRFDHLSRRCGHHFNTLVTIRNERTSGEVTFEVDQVIQGRNDWTLMRFKSLSKDHPDLRLTILNE